MVRVAEFVSHGSGIAAAYAGWLLARLGAEVTRLTVQENRAGASPVQLALEVLADGKTTIPCPADIDSLLADYDILLCDAPSALVAVTGTLASLRARLPRLVIGVATPLGLSGPYAAFPSVSLDAQALSAVAWSLGEPGRAPLSLPPGIVEHQAGTMLAAGTLLALQVRDARGTGRLVDIALSEVLASYVATNCRVYIHHGLRWQRSGRRASGSGGAYPYVILPCQDGEVCLFGRTREEWERLVHVMGDPAWATLPRYQDLRAVGTQYPEEVDQFVLPWLARHTKAELAAIALEHNLILSPVQDFTEILQTPQFAARQFFVSRRVRDHTVQVPYLPFRITESRAESATNIASTLLKGTALPEPASSPNLRPLSGLRVLDFGWVWSAPWVSTMLGELGAQVIKVEHAKRPDNLRLSGRVIRNGEVVAGPSKEMSPMYHQVNHGKLGITLNTKEPRAVALLKRLAAMSDLVVENMSPGSIERVHLGYDTLREANPRLVMLAMSAAGQFGPLANMRAYAPNMSSAAGLEALVGYRHEAPIGALNFGLGDPNASTHALVAVLAALRRARLTGQGCYIDLSQIEALLGTLRPYLIDSQVHERQSPTQGNTHLEMAPHGIYPASEPDHWLTLAVTSDREWQALQKIVHEEWIQDPRFESLAGRLAQVDDLDLAIARWTGNQPREALVATLRAAGIAASPVLSIDEQWRDPHFAARGVKHRVDIPFYGAEDLFQAPWQFSDFSPEITACGPTTGQHNDYVLGELLGLAPEEIAELKQSGVVA
jgi:crotonobetainyl-CoA:carnitine CoA-transferase CaiB-like acyl-CoA transferase